MTTGSTRTTEGMLSMAICVAVAGATGWAGSAVTRALIQSEEFVLVGAVSRSHAGQDIGEVLGLSPCGVVVAGTVPEALTSACDVLIDYTHPTVVKQHAITALESGVHVVIGTSGLTAEDFEEIDEIARRQGKGVVAAGNFSLTAALAKHFSLMAAQYLGSWEIVEYASQSKVDAPGGTVQELAESLSAIRQPDIFVPRENVIGRPQSRGADIQGTTVHAVRLPGYILGFDVLFGMPDERLTIHHEAGQNASPYVAGTLLAARKVGQVSGIVRGLDTLLFLNNPDQ